jgi:hypothetical protein
MNDGPSEDGDRLTLRATTPRPDPVRGLAVPHAGFYVQQAG